MGYSELLKDPRWQQKRLLILQRDKWTCTECSNTKLTLHVHHKRYIYNRDPWDYDDSILTTLCENCHEIEEELKRDNLLYTHAKAANVTCIDLWTSLNVLSFLGKSHPEEYRKLRNYLREEFIQKYKEDLVVHITELSK